MLRPCNYSQSLDGQGREFWENILAVLWYVANQVICLSVMSWWYTATSQPMTSWCCSLLRAVITGYLMASIENISNNSTIPLGDVCPGVSAQGGVCPSACWDTHTLPVPVDRMTDRCKTLPCNNSNIIINLITVITDSNADTEDSTTNNRQFMIA